MSKSELSKQVTKVCKICQGHECCRYLSADREGFKCAKNDGLKNLLDERVKKKTIVARGDNCEGIIGVL